jgi:hypothetical protein
MNKLFSSIALFCLAFNAAAQTVNLYFPKFAGSEYYFTVFQGQNSDTIQRGVIPDNGKLSIVFPKKLAGYEGLCSWTLAKGGGLPFIVTPAGLDISCTENVPTTETIIFKNSIENNSYNLLMNEQSTLFGKIENYFKNKQSFEQKNNMVEVFQDNFPELKKEFETYGNKLAQNKLYAAFLIRLNNYITGIGNTIYPPSQADANTLFDKEITKYITEEVDMKRLYTSGRWNHLISICFRLFPEQKDFGGNMVKILKRTQHQRTLELFANDLMMICEQFGWDDARTVIVDYLESSGRIPEPTGLVRLAFMLNKTKPGVVAPPVTGVSSVANSLLIFYESGCDHCNEQLDWLIKNYNTLKEKGIKVISLSTDTSEEVFKYHSAKFPWKDKLCDYKGIKGENFEKYGVFGTPTIYYIDKNGKIVDRKAKMEQIDLK